jgi:peptidoglycan/xylan/chitin deacetylase (PgdA/CDA1 family)
MTRNSLSLQCTTPSADRRRFRFVYAIVLVLLALVLHPSEAEAAARRSTAFAAGSTVISLEFDDARANAFQALGPLEAHRMHATFFVPSGLVGTTGYMSFDELGELSRLGNEIGGHTITHPHLRSLSDDEKRRQICNDRVNLASHGFAVSDFAYPYGEYDAKTQQAVRDCGYSSARRVDGIATSSECVGECPALPSCTTTACPYSESIPPADVYAIRTPGAIGAAQTVEKVKAEIGATIVHGGGWLNLVFHQLCDACGPQGFSVRNFVSLLDWLSSRVSHGVVVATVRDVVGANSLPPISGPPAPAPRSGSQLLKNSSLENWTGPVPECFERGGYGNNDVLFLRAQQAHNGRAAMTVKITRYISGDQKLVTAQDQGDCSPSVVSGRRYHVGVWYQTDVIATITLFYRDATGRWIYWASSPTWPPSSRWHHASWTTPPTPADAKALSFGMTIAQVGTITTDDYVVSSGSSGVLPAVIAIAIVVFATAVGVLLVARRRSRYRTSSEPSSDQS